MRKELTSKEMKHTLVKMRKKLAAMKKEPDPGPLRGRSRPSKKEIDAALKSISKIKFFLAKGQAYEQASQIRDVERFVMKIRDSHPEQFSNEEFLMNIKNTEDYKDVKLPHFIKSVRIGKTAYTTDFKEKVRGYKPVFGVLRTKKIINGTK